MRYSTLLPIGNGLQMSFIWEYLFRANKGGVDPFGPPPPCLAAGTCVELVGPNVPVAALNKGGGIWATFNLSAPNAYYANTATSLPMASTCAIDQNLLPVQLGGLSTGVPTKRCGQLALDLFSEIVRANFWGLTGTYYDKDLTDIVFRYDFAYLPKTAYFGHNHLANTPLGPFKTVTTQNGKDNGDWTDKFSAIVAFDRPTYIPWISKQHTFLVAQQTSFWFPGAHDHPVLSVASTGGKFRKNQNFSLLAAVNWLFDGRLVTTNAFFWDDDDNTGFVSTNNAFRYSRNILFNFNVQWYLGESGRYTDPVLLSRSQSINEAEFRLTYEI